MRWQIFLLALWFAAQAVILLLLGRAVLEDAPDALLNQLVALWLYIGSVGSCIGSGVYLWLGVHDAD